MLASLLIALVFTAQAPPPVATPYVATSGKTIGVRFAKPDGTFAIPTASMAAPVVSRNGVPVGPLVNPWVTGYHTAALYGLPSGTTIAPGDVVTISAPAGWASTNAGAAAPMTALSVDNRAGRSAVGTDKLPKTLKPGWNNAHLGSQYGSVYSVPKNWARRCDTFGTAPTVTYDATGKPVYAGAGRIGAYFFNMVPQATIDQTISVPVGLWAVGWDNTDPAHPTTCSLETYSPLMISLAERPDMANPGVDGKGIVKVYEVKQLATTPQDTKFNAVVSLRLIIANPAKVLSYDNLVVYGPGDFASAAGQPTVLDRSDPFAISQVYLDRLGEGAGSLRWVDSLWGYGGISQVTQPEQAFRLTDFTWGLWTARTDISPNWTTARPWNPAVTPYFYSTLFGDPFPATLGAPIDAAATVLNIPDAATAPVIVGLRLKAGDELMRVMSVVDTSVTVERGSCATTAVPHDAGPIMVQNRWRADGAAIPQGMMIELVNATPHRVETGQQLTAYGAWPQMLFADGTRPFGGTINGYANLHCVTGQNTAVLVLPGNQKPWVTLAQSYTLPVGCRSGLGAGPMNPAIPVELAARACTAVGADFHVNVPHAASDSLVDQIALWARDNIKPGGKVFVEYSNEPWNYYFNNYNMLSRFSTWLEPGTGDWGFYARRSTQVWQRFRDRFGDRKSEVVGLINNNKNDASGVAARLEFCHQLGVPVGVVAIAVYTGVDRAPASQVAFWGFDDEQAVDMYIHDLYYNTTQYPQQLKAMNAVIAAYNLKYGENVQLYAYEGGIGCAAPVLTTSLVGGIDAATQVVNVAPWADIKNIKHDAATGLIPGIPMLCESEWMTISAVAGNTLTLTRGQYGTVAAPHAAGKMIRPAYLERSHDIIYNPNWYFAEHDFYGFFQSQGFTRLNSYALSMGAADANSYFGAYHIQTQLAGRGDGSDGKADNRLVLARPGLPASKGPMVNQDAATVSVRGRAFLDWMKGVKADGQLSAIQKAVMAIQAQIKTLRDALDALDAQAKGMLVTPH